MSSLEKGSATFGNAAELYRVRVQSDTRLKPSSKVYRCQTIDAILRFRPEWNERLIREIRESDCLRWAATYSGKVQGTRFNNTVGTLRAIFELGLKNGLLADNPARSIRKVRVSGKRLRLPSAEQFADILVNIESSGAWCAQKLWVKGGRLFLGANPVAACPFDLTDAMVFELHRGPTRAPGWATLPKLAEHWTEFEAALKNTGAADLAKRINELYRAFKADVNASADLTDPDKAA